MNIRIIRVIVCTAAFGVFGASAAIESGKPASQHERFAACAHESKGLKGDAHQDFMSECLKGHDAEASELKRDAPRKTTADASFQQSKMKICNDEAREKNLHGDERRAFMANCLKS